MKFRPFSGPRSRSLWPQSVFEVTTVILVVGGLLVSLFDLLRKTLFVNADWNYNYLPLNFVYNEAAVVALLVLLAGFVFVFPRLADLPPAQFAVTLFGFSVVLFVLGLYALPLKLTTALDVDQRGLYNSAVFMTQHGPLDFLESFHRLKATTPPQEHIDLYAVNSFSMTQENAAANYFATWFSTLDWVPFNDSIAAYVSEYTTQKHGPAVVFMIAPFLLLLGPTTTSALVGNILLISIVPVIGYYTFRLYFSELISRLVAALIAIGPGLFMWTRHASPVPYDSFTALFVAGATYLLLRGVRSDRRRYYLAAGVVLSLAALTKLTALVVWLPFVLIVFRGTPNVMTAVQRTAETVSAWFIIPITFLLAGYNFIAQYLYTVYKLTLYKVQKESGGSGGGQAINDPAAALDDPVIGLLGTLYNIRWMNLALCLLGVVFVLLVIWDRSRLERIEYLIAAAMVTAFLPFGIWVLFSAGTLSRHTIMLSVPLGFIGCVGISMLKSYSPNVDHTRLVRFGQAALLISATQLVINI